MDSDCYSPAALGDAKPIGVPCCSTCGGPMFRSDAFCRLIEREPDSDGPYACSWLCGQLGAGRRRVKTWSDPRLRRAARLVLQAAIKTRRATRGAFLHYRD